MPINTFALDLYVQISSTSSGLLSSQDVFVGLQAPRSHRRIQLNPNPISEGKEGGNARKTYASDTSHSIYQSMHLIPAEWS